MTANIWKDNAIAFWGVGVALVLPPVQPASRAWEGSFRIIGAEPFDFAGHYRMELEDGDSAEIIVTHILRRDPTIVHFRIVASKSEPLAFNTAQHS